MSEETRKKLIEARKQLMEPAVDLANLACSQTAGELHQLISNATADAITAASNISRALALLDATSTTESNT